MPRRTPVIETVNSSEARANWSQLLKKAHGGKVRLLIEKDGTPVAGIISARDLEKLAMLEAERERSMAVIDEIREAFRDVPDEELKREIDKAVAEARTELRAERAARRAG